MVSGMKFGLKGGRTSIAMEQIVRPWVDVLSFSRLREVPVIEEEPEAFLRWGQAAEFLFDQNTFRNTAGKYPGFRVNDPDDPDETIVFTETGRDVTVVRVANPDDENQFVDVERIDKIRFQSNGQAYTFILTNG